MATTRKDHTDYVIHWTKGSMDEAFESLVSIAIDEQIIGSSSRITSGDKCICFSEAPQNFFHEREGQFKPFGIRLSKKWLFSLGGRPVIYQAADEFDLLPDCTDLVIT